MANAGTRKKLSKMAAVRRAMNKRGIDAKPAVIRDYIKTRYGIEMSSQMVSNYKSLLAKKMPTQSTLIPIPRGRPTRAASSLSMADIKEVKTLVERLGVDKVRQLTKLVTE